MAVHSSTGVHKALMSRLAGKRAIRAYTRKLADPDDIRDLNITPMMDMMTIILVFLLKTFTSSSATLKLDDNLKLAPSTTQLRTKEAINVTVTKRVIMVEGEAVANITGGKVEPSQKRDGENGYYITGLVDILQKYANRDKKRAAIDQSKFEGELMLVADNLTPYRTVTEVLYSAGQAGYGNYRLLVLKKNE